VRECGTGGEADEEVVYTQSGSDSDAQNCQQEVEHDKGGFANKFARVGEAQDVVRSIAQNKPNHNTEGALVEDCYQEPVADYGASGAIAEDCNADIKERKGRAVICTGFAGKQVFDACWDAARELRV